MSLVGNHKNYTRHDYTRIVGNHNSIDAKHCTIIGNHNIITGDGHNVTGNHNKVLYSNGIITGNHNKIVGNNCTITGNYNKVTGTNNTVTGENCILNGEPVGTASTRVNYFNSNGFSFDGSSVSIVGAGVDFGNGPVIPGIYGSNNTFGGNVTFNNTPNTSNISIGSIIDGIGLVQSSGGSTTFNFTDGNIQVVPTGGTGYMSVLGSNGVNEQKIKPKKSVKKTLIKQLKKIKDTECKNEDNECSICITNEKIVAIQCGHRFCSTCTQQFINDKNICPNCRTKIKTIIRIY